MHGLVVPSDFFLEVEEMWRIGDGGSLCVCVMESFQVIKGSSLREKWIAPSIWWDEVHSPEVNPLTAAPCSATPKNLCTKINYNRMSNDSKKNGILQLFSASLLIFCSLSEPRASSNAM